MAGSFKTCPKCKKSLPISAFYKLHCSPDGLQYTCKYCTKKWHIKDRLNNPGLSASKQRNYRRIVKKEVFDHYGNNCTCCGEKEIAFLSIDHINGNGVKHRLQISGLKREGAGSRTYSWLRKNNYPPGFQVLCMNCNWAKSRGGCPHQKTSKLALTQ